MRHATLTLVPLMIALSLDACSGTQTTHAASQQTHPSTRPSASIQKSLNQPEKNNMTLTGTLKMRGGSRMAHLELMTPHGSYRILNSESFGLMHKQNQSVHLKVRLVKQAIGPGFPAEIEVLLILK